MKLLELEIKNVRGIRHLLLEPNEKNFAIYGPNGSGKSAVVDSIDFLLTGRISRLTGKGTKGITLSKHGPHINCHPNQATVRAKIKIPELNEPVEIKRCIDQPNLLEYDESIKAHLEPIIKLAERGQYVLTRRYISKYITAPPNDRAKEIQALLNIQDIENIRKKLVKISNSYDNDLKGANKSLEHAKNFINATIEESVFNKKAIIDFINKNRSILKGNPISSLDWKNLKKGLIPPSTALIIRKDIPDNKEIQKLLSYKERVNRYDRELRSLIERIIKRPEMSKKISRLALTELGITLIDETGDCPLCDASWEKGELEEKLKERISKTKDLKKIQDGINEIAMKLIGIIDDVTYKIQKIIELIYNSELKEEVTIFEANLSQWKKYREIINKVNQMRYKYQFDKNIVNNLVAPNGIEVSLKKVQDFIKDRKMITIPETTPEQRAWDNLTRLEENLKGYETNHNKCLLIQKSFNKAELLSKSFQQAKDKVLSKLYKNINGRFVELYKKIHGEDEDNFSASIRPDGAGVSFKVDFYGCGTHPPHALHSEGHQDSMGLCLYLALAEKINENLIDLIILDDVVMSIDTGHRKSICTILTENFPDRQFLITTHDKTWTNQLKYNGVVNSKEITEFYNWNIINGPLYFNYQVEIWNPIENALKKNNVSTASFHLRNGLEQFFEMVSNDLKATIMYKSDHNYDFGDFLNAAISRYKELLKRAKASAQSWGNEEELEILDELDSTRSQILRRTQAEQWAINANVHYNNWANFSINDFRSVVEAFHDLCLLFKCSKCGGILYLSTKGQDLDAVRCYCGNINWNLVKKKN